LKKELINLDDNIEEESEGEIVDESWKLFGF